MQASGGYIINRRPLVRSGIHAHTSALERPVSDTDLAALNSVQATAWRINTGVLDVMLQAWNTDQRIAGLVTASPVAIPDRMDDAVWASLALDDRKVHLKARAESHAVNASAQGRQQALLDCLTVANELRDYERIWFPHSRCFRGRLHPIPAVGPSPQGHDISKSLLQFGNGMPLGPDGLYWLCVRLANACGQDKLPLDDRMAWTMERANLIAETAQDPLGHPWWGAVDAYGDAVLDEPWGALATILELGEALWCDDPEAFVSYLPVAMDGACNGIQHLSAMGLDPVGARATNLCRGEGRQDIYTEVADAVRVMVERDAAAGVELALQWHGKVTRKTVKRAVMTTPYGVTDGGIRKQLLSDGLVPDGDAQGAAADYLRDCLVAALGETVVAAKSIMAWLQTVADRLARAGLPYDFRTPSGSLVRQAYYAVTSDRVITLVGRLTLDTELKSGPLNPRKCALAASPNTIHAFDASHLSLTVNEAVRSGINSFAMIHDSYGTHAGQTTRLARILRETFVTMYETDQLAAIRDYVAGYAPHVELPPLPERGGFDIRQVLDAPFFFS